MESEGIVSILNSFRFMQILGYLCNTCTPQYSKWAIYWHRCVQRFVSCVQLGQTLVCMKARNSIHRI